MKIKGGQDRYEIVDYLKGFSIITIIVMHLLQMYPVPSIIYKLSSLGGTGVHMFFLCSGFGLSFSQAKSRMKFGEFIKKRFLKIYLPYIIAVIIIFFIPFSFEGSFEERLIALASHIFLFKMFIPALEGSFSYPLWYMSTLFQFYFAFVGLFKIQNIIGSKKYLKICIIISAAWWIFTACIGVSEERIWGSFFLQYLWEFALGMCVAEELNNGKDISLKSPIVIVVAISGLAIGGILGIKGGIFKAFNDIFLATGYAAIAILVYKYVSLYKKLCIVVNKFSYELYLVHVICFAVIYQLLNSVLPSVFLMIISIIVSIFVAYIYHEIIRMVTMKHKNNMKFN